MILKSCDFANQVIFECDSTNDLAKQLAEEGYPDGTWVSSRIQSQGKGRMGHAWQSPIGNLYLSIVMRKIFHSHWTWVPLVISSAIVRFFRKSFDFFDIRVKWPNDLWIENVKVGGVLCEGSLTPGNSYIVSGIGLNCSVSPQVKDQKTGNLSSISIQKGFQALCADELRRPILNAILKGLDRFSQGDFFEVHETYKKWPVFENGMEIEWGNPSQRGKVCGLGSHGELQVITLEDGKRKSLFSDEISVVRNLCSGKFN